MAINWDILFANNSGQDAVNSVATIMKEFADRDLAKQVQNSNMKQKTWEKKEDLQSSALDRESELASAMYGSEAKSQESQLNRKNALDVAYITARGKTQEQEIREINDQRRHEQDMQLKYQQEQADRAEAARKAQLEQEQSFLAKQKENREALIAKENLDVNRQNANTQESSVLATIAKGQQTAPGLGGYNPTTITPTQTKRTGLDSPFYNPVGVDTNLFKGW